MHYIAAVQSRFGITAARSAPRIRTLTTVAIATVTYTASSDNLICSIIAVEAKGGRTAESVIYQGTDAKLSPTVDASWPSTQFAAGGATTTFSEKCSTILVPLKPLQASRVSFYIWQASPHSKNVNANQVHVSYSTAGPHRHLQGLTAHRLNRRRKRHHWVPWPATGFDYPRLAPLEKITFHVETNSSVPASSTSALLSFESYLEAG